MTNEVNNKKGTSFVTFLHQKRAQIRGIDFALALLIFILAFSQVILVLTNLLIPSLVQLEAYSQEQEVNKHFSNVFLTQGTPTSWGTIPTDVLPEFKLGLQNTHGLLDFTKINRLVSGVSSYWAIDYVSVKISYSMIKDFVIEITSPINIEINSMEVFYSYIEVKGEVLEYYTSIEGANIWAFAIDSENQVSTNSTTTKNIDDSIAFSVAIPIDAADYYVVAIIAEVGGIYQDYEVKHLERVGFPLDFEYRDFDIIPFIQENDDSPSSAIDVSYNKLSIEDEVSATVVFPFEGLDVQYFQQDMILIDVPEEGDIYQALNVPVPSSGFAVVIITEQTSSDYRVGYIGIPMLLSPEHGGYYGATDKLAQTTISMNQMITIRDILVKCQIWYG
ncbi:hypothetical protein ES705_24619 [subsurface metagenome]